MNNIEGVLGRQTAAAGNLQPASEGVDSETSRQRGKQGGLGKDPLPPHDAGRDSIHINLLLEPQDFELQLEEAPTEEAAKAYRKGTLIPGKRNSLKLVSRPHCREDRFMCTQELYDEGREWWEKG